jgi:hypothetical protein
MCVGEYILCALFFFLLSMCDFFPAKHFDASLRERLAQDAWQMYGLTEGKSAWTRFTWNTIRYVGQRTPDPTAGEHEHVFTEEYSEITESTPSPDTPAVCMLPLEQWMDYFGIPGWCYFGRCNGTEYVACKTDGADILDIYVAFIERSGVSAKDDGNTTRSMYGTCKHLFDGTLCRVFFLPRSPLQIIVCYCYTFSGYALPPRHLCTVYFQNKVLQSIGGFLRVTTSFSRSTDVPTENRENRNEQTAAGTTYGSGRQSFLHFRTIQWEPLLFPYSQLRSLRTHALLGWCSSSESRLTKLPENKDTQNEDENEILTGYMFYYTWPMAAVRLLRKSSSSGVWATLSTSLYSTHPGNSSSSKTGELEDVDPQHKIPEYHIDKKEHEKEDCRYFRRVVTIPSPQLNRYALHIIDDRDHEKQGEGKKDEEEKNETDENESDHSNAVRCPHYHSNLFIISPPDTRPHPYPRFIGSQIARQNSPLFTWWYEQLTTQTYWQHLTNHMESISVWDRMLFPRT